MNSKQLVGLILISTLLAAFTKIGEFAELEKYMNGRSSGQFLKTNKNVKFQIPKGTVGQITKIKKFHSGNYGIEMELKNNNPGEKVWVYYTPQSPNMSFHKENPLEKIKSETGLKEANKNETPKKNEFARTEEEMSALKAAGEIDKRIKVEVESAAKKLSQANSIVDQKCDLCEISHTGKIQDDKCETFRKKVGILTAYRTRQEGQCEVGYFFDDEKLYLNKIKYIVKNDGAIRHISSSESGGFYSFPRNKSVDFEISDDQSRLILKSSSDVSLEIDTKSGNLIKVNGVKDWDASLSVTPKPDQLILDMGRGIGEHPERKLHRTSQIKTSSGKSCNVKNSELFSHKKDANGFIEQVDFNFFKDEDFLNFAKSKCK